MRCKRIKTKQRSLRQPAASGARVVLCTRMGWRPPGPPTACNWKPVRE